MVNRLHAAAIEGDYQRASLLRAELVRVAPLDGEEKEKREWGQVDLPVEAGQDVRHPDGVRKLSIAQLKNRSEGRPAQVEVTSVAEAHRAVRRARWELLKRAEEAGMAIGISEAGPVIEALDLVEGALRIQPAEYSAVAELGREFWLDYERLAEYEGDLKDAYSVETRMDPETGEIQEWM